MKRIYEIACLGVLSRVLCLLLGLVSHSGMNLEFQRNTILLGNSSERTWVYHLLSPFLQWDGLHFLNIALRGYDSVLEHAFFPGLPLIMRAFSQLLTGYYLEPHFALAISGILFVQISFVLGAVGLYRLSIYFLADERRAYRATLFYVFASCNIFMSALYTESPFSMLTFWGLYWLYARNNLMLSSLLLACAGLFRSNGLLGIIFIVHYSLSRGVDLFRGLMASLSVYLPYYLYSTWSRNMYCELTPTPHEWCASHNSIYGYIQKQFWGVSLFSYWRMDNIGYFLLMLPTLVVALHAPYYYLLDLMKQGRVLSFRSWTISNKRFPFLLQMGILTAFTVFIANCQILTRILSSCPLYFWTLENISFDDGKNSKPWRSRLMARAILGAHFSYYLVGPLIFSNGLNWT